jgi:hypothetical protein
VDSERRPASVHLEGVKYPKQGARTTVDGHAAIKALLKAAEGTLEGVSLDANRVNELQPYRLGPPASRPQSAPEMVFLF